MTKLLAPLSLVLFALGCATPPASHVDKHEPLSVSVPIRYAGILDLRKDFEPFLSSELNAKSESHPGRTTTELLDLVDLPPTAKVVSFPIAHPKLSRTTVLLVPGIFGECFDTMLVPFGDGKTRDKSLSYVDAYREHQETLGLRELRSISTLGRGGTHENAIRIDAALSLAQDDSGTDNIFLFAYSKGASDSLVALAELEKAGKLPSKLKAFVSLAGVVMGTPLADRLFPLYQTLGRQFPISDCAPSDGEEVAALRSAVRLQLMKSSDLPRAIALYSLVSYAERKHISKVLLPFYDELTKFDTRNDGQILARDAILPKSKLVAAVNSDHWSFILPMAQSDSWYLRSVVGDPDFPQRALFRALVRFVAADLNLD